MVSLRLPVVAEVESLKLEDRTLFATHFGYALEDLGATHTRTLAALPKECSTQQPEKGASALPTRSLCV